MKNLVRVVSLSLLLSGIGMIAMPTLAEAACCSGGGSTCCGDCCEGSSTGCSAGPCVIKDASAVA